MGGDDGFRVTRARIEYVWNGEPVVLSYERLADGSVLLVDSASDWSATVGDEDAALARFMGMLIAKVSGMAGDEAGLATRGAADRVRRAADERGEAEAQWAKERSGETVAPVPVGGRMRYDDNTTPTWSEVIAVLPDADPEKLEVVFDSWTRSDNGYDLVWSLNGEGGAPIQAGDGTRLTFVRRVDAFNHSIKPGTMYRFMNRNAPPVVVLD